jgi:MOSC domain-containing protein YiiM
MLNPGRVVGIYISSQATNMPHRVDSATAVANRGLKGDRYYQQKGTFSHAEPQGPGRELTLIEQQSLVLLAQEYKIDLSPEAARRNLLVDHIDLNQLVGRQFYVGEVLVLGIRLCPPCVHLAPRRKPRAVPERSASGYKAATEQSEEAINLWH